MSNEHDLADSTRRMQALRRRLEADGAGSVELHETHISWVLLAGDFAYKIKKPVKLPFLDFSTLAARRHFCDEELRLNRRLAPSLYLEVIEIHDTPGGPAFGGEGPVVEAALKMRRFPARALLSERLAAGLLTADHIDRLARRIAAFHRDAAVAPPGSDFGSATLNERATRRVSEAIDAWLRRIEVPGAQAWPALREWLMRELQRLAPFWAQRREGGSVRECHGDLHLANTLVLGDEVTAFDCIEFDPALRWIDVMNDVAFTVMDLLAHGRASLAFRFLDGWLQESGEYDGLPSLRFFMVYRALVRAQVAALGEAQDLRAAGAPDACDYLRLAVRLADAGEPRLAITHGLPGSGKTFVSQHWLEQAGAVRVRSDVERKRLAGLAPLASSKDRVPGLYDSAATTRTYERLLAVARVVLRSEYPAIVDAAFLRRDERAAFAALARETGVPFTIIDCRAAPEVLHERLVQRQAAGSDASEADVAVLERLALAAEPLDDAERAHAIVVDDARPARIAEQCAAWLGSAQAGAVQA